MKVYSIKRKLLVGILCIGLTMTLLMFALFYHSTEKQAKKYTSVGVTAVDLEQKLQKGERIAETTRKLPELIRYKYVVQSKPDYPYNLEDLEKKDFSRGQSKFIEETLNSKKNGFFIDIGAGDGETDSVSLLFEREHKWNGLLIEPNPDKQQELRVKNRKADTLHGCVNDDNFAAQRKFRGSRMMSKTDKGPDENVNIDGSYTYTAMCFPFASILSAIKRTQVDLLTLNVNGHELAILKTIPFYSMDIDIVSVEFEQEITNELLEFMNSKGYTAINLMDNRVLEKKDIIFKSGR